MVQHQESVQIIRSCNDVGVDAIDYDAKCLATSGEHTTELLGFALVLHLRSLCVLIHVTAELLGPLAWPEL